jgi:ubiquinone/menaquinone biosynthesis C-methylase UbiE
MNDKVCPWWLGYLLASPIRTLAQDPQKILRPYIKEGDTTLDVGSAMGFFTLPMARLVGERGRVVCVDLQEKMINGLRRRASRGGLIDRMDLRVCTPESLNIDDLAGTIDFALAFAVVHEVPGAKRFLSEIHAALKTGGHLLLSEPTGHVSEQAFAKTLSIAQSVGFRVADTPAIHRSHSRFLAVEKK